MNGVVIGLLVALWAAILLPGLLRARHEASPAASVSRFNRSMDHLERTNGAPAPGTSRAGRAPSPPARPLASPGARSPAPRSDAAPRAGRAATPWRMARRGLAGARRRSVSLAARPRRALGHEPSDHPSPGLSVVERRRVAVLGLLTAQAVTLAAAAFVGGVAWGGAAAVAVAFIAYCLQLRRVVLRERRHARHHRRPRPRRAVAHHTAAGPDRAQPASRTGPRDRTPGQVRRSAGSAVSGVAAAPRDGLDGRVAGRADPPAAAANGVPAALSVAPR